MSYLHSTATTSRLRLAPILFCCMIICTMSDDVELYTAARKERTRRPLLAARHETLPNTYMYAISYLISRRWRGRVIYRETQPLPLCVLRKIVNIQATIFLSSLFFASDDVGNLSYSYADLHTTTFFPVLVLTIRYGCLRSSRYVALNEPLNKISSLLGIYIVSVPSPSMHPPFISNINTCTKTPRKHVAVSTVAFSQ